MKKSILTWVVLMMITVSTTFAHTVENVSELVMSSFKRDFVSAQDVTWEKTKDIAKATFKMNDQVMFAYYSEEGNLLAAIRNIVSSQLPINLQTDLKKTYNGYWISDLFEMASDNSTTYYVTVEDGGQKVVLRSIGSSGWETFRKEKKQ